MLKHTLHFYQKLNKMTTIDSINNNMKPMKTIKFILPALVFSLLFISCGTDKTAHTEDNSLPISVHVNQVNENSTSAVLSVSGKIQAVSSADLSTRMMGYVKDVHVNVGDRVKKGQLLVSINATDLQAKRAQVNAGITEAKAAFSNAEKDYLRYKNLYLAKSASQKEMDDMTAHFEMAKARLEVANQMKNEINAQFSYTNISAPFSGTITRKTCKIGDMASPGAPLISIEKLGEFEVLAMVPETEISNIKKGMDVAVRVKASNTLISGKVTEVSASSKHTGGQYAVKVTLNKTDTSIRSGMFTTVQIPMETKSTTEAVLIPNSILVQKGQLTGIYVISSTNTAMLRWIRVGKTIGNNVEVLSGLSQGEFYITSSKGKLYNGVKISIEN